jgi:hypothetical protein
MLLLHWIHIIESLMKFNAGYLPVPGNLLVCGGRQPLFLCAQSNLFPHRHKFSYFIYSDGLTAAYPLRFS